MKEEDFYISESSTELVALNTMIPRKTRGQLEECRGWLQTSERLHSFSLQKTVQLAIENLHQDITEELARLDKVVEMKTEEKPREEGAASFPSEKPVQSVHERFNVEEYKGFSNDLKRLPVTITTAKTGFMVTDNHPIKKTLGISKERRG